MHLDVLLANKLKEFAHLLNRGLIALTIVPTARTIPIMLFLLRIEDVSDDSFQFGREVFLRAGELEYVRAILLGYLRYFIRNTIFFILGLRSLHLALQSQRLSLLNSVVFLDLQESFLGDT